MRAGGLGLGSELGYRGWGSGCDYGGFELMRGMEWGGARLLPLGHLGQDPALRHDLVSG